MQLKEKNLKQTSIDILDATKVVKIGIELSSQIKKEMICILKEHRHCFAWSYKEIQGIDLHIAFHMLHLNQNFTPIKKIEGISPQNIMKQ